MKQLGVIRKPYTGSRKAIVIAFDVGTTFSGVSYALLDPGGIPKIYEVTRFPGQEHQAGNPKIPSVVWYDRHGDPVKAGAEAEEQFNVNTAEEQGWSKVELFKLRLRPKSMKLDMNGMKLPHLPRSKSALQVFGDFLKYLFRCTRSFIVESHADGPSVWKTVEDEIQFVLSHPNGWEGAQQSKMRKAAIYGGLVPNTDEGKARVRFVTEGEASLHACVMNGLADSVLSNPSQHGFVVADAGGGTLDISSYAIKNTSPLMIEEIAPPDCLFSGSVFVSRRARRFLEDKLKASAQYGTPAVLDHIAKRFDETTKRLFRGRGENQYLHFGSPLDKDHSVGIRNGKLKLTGDEVAELFEPSIDAAVASIRNQVVLSGGLVKSVWLVGGFASSPWLFHQLQERLQPDGIVVSRPDGQTSKAVANGAIGFYCDHHVGARIAKYMYGVEFLREFDHTDPEHNERQSRLFQLPSGPKLLPDAFDCILARNSRVKESTTFSRKYCTELTSLSTLALFEIEIWCYRGPGEQPKWILRGQDDFSTLCFVRADLSPLTASARAMTGHGGKKYWTIVFSIEIHFGLTEFKARIKWTDDGKVVKYGPASIVYDESGNKELEDDRDSQDEISALPPSRYASRGPSMPPSRTHSASNTPQTLQSPADEHSVAGTFVVTPISRSHSASQSHVDRHPDGHPESSVSKKSKSSSPHSNHKSPPQQISPNPSNVSHHTSRSDRSQHSPHSSHHHSVSPPRETSHRTPSPRELSATQSVLREPSQLGHQSNVSNAQHRDREIPRSEHHIPNYYASATAQSHVTQRSPLPSVLGDTAPGISRTHGRSKSIVTTTQPPEPTPVTFPSVSNVTSPHDTPVSRSVRESRTTSLTPSDSASNVHANYLYGPGAVPGSIAGSLVGFPQPESNVNKKSKKDKNKSLLTTITSASNSTTGPMAEQPPPFEAAPPLPQITIPDSPSVSSSIGGSRLTTNPNTPINARALKSSLASTLSYVTDRPEQPPPPIMSRQNSDSVVAGGLGSALGGVLNNVWGAYKSASASPVVENPPPGPATAAFESTLETIEDVEIPGGFGEQHERDAPVPPQDEVFGPVIIPPSPPKPEELETATKVPTPKVEISNLPASEPITPQPDAELGQSALSPAERKKAKKQREKERKEKEAQEKKEREERERIEREEQAKKEREEQAKKEREEHERKKAERDAKKREREERERQEQEKIEREANERAEREAREHAKRVEQEAKEREARERESRERTERVERADREAKEAQQRTERQAKEQGEMAREKMDRISKKRAERDTTRRAEQEAAEKAKREEKERVEKEAKEREAKEKADREAREKAEREAEAKREAREKEAKEARERAEEARQQAEREKERLEKEKEREVKEKEKADREAKAREEEKNKVSASKIQSPWGTGSTSWGSTSGKNGDRSRKTSTGLSQKEQKNEWANTWGDSENREEPSHLPSIITSSIHGGGFSNPGNFDFFTKADSPGGVGEEVELRTPLTKRGKNGINAPSNLSREATPLEPIDAGKHDHFEEMGLNNMSSRVSISSENERFTDAEEGPTTAEPTHPTLAPEVVPESFSNSTSELLKTPQGAKAEVPTAPNPWPAPSLTTTQLQPPNPAPLPAQTEPEKPLSLWDRKKLRTSTIPPASGLFGTGDSANSSEAWGLGNGKNGDTIAMPALTSERQSVVTDTARDQKRENQRENLVEDLLGSNQTRRRNDSSQSQMTTKPASRSPPAPAPTQKSSGWGSWGSSIINNLASAVAAPDRSPSPEPASQIKPKIEDPPRGFTPNQPPPKSQPAGFGSQNKTGTGWVAGGTSGGTGPWNKNGPTQAAQKPPTGPVWGAKPGGTGFGSGQTGWGTSPGPTFGSGMNKNLTVDTTRKPLESSPNTPGPENVPESAVEVKYVPAPGGGLHGSIADNNETGETQESGWGQWGDVGGDKDLKRDPSPEKKEPAPVAEAAEEAVKVEDTPTEEAAKTEDTPAEEDDYEWPNAGKKKKGKVASVAQTPSAPNTPDPDNQDDGANGGGGGKKKRKKAKKT